MADGSCRISKSLTKIYSQFAIFEVRSHGNKGSIKNSTKEDLGTLRGFKNLFCSF